MRAAAAAVVPLAALGLTACRSTWAQKPITPVAHLDLHRYMGRWYVIAAIPSRIERHDDDPVEDYRRMPDGSICTVFRADHVLPMRPCAVGVVRCDGACQARRRSFCGS